MTQCLKNFSLRLDPAFAKEMQKIHGFYEQYGQIVIDNFKEGFVMSEQAWSIEDYLLQWRCAWEYFKQHKSTCFIVNMQPSTPHMTFWCLYKIHKKIHIQNYLINPVRTKKLLHTYAYTPSNSFFYIPQREEFTEDGYKISEWIVQPTAYERKLLNM